MYAENVKAFLNSSLSIPLNHDIQVALCPTASVSTLTDTISFPGAAMVKNPPANQETQETWVPFLVWEDPLEEEISIPVVLPGESHGQGSLASCSPWGCRVGHDLATEHVHTH